MYKFIIFFLVTCATLAMGEAQIAAWVGRCDSDDYRTELRSQINEYIQDVVNPMLNDVIGPPCNCGGPEWTNVVDLNMSDPTQPCPGDWQEVTDDSFRGCQNSAKGCHSANFSTFGGLYSEVCGRMIGVQYGDPDAFFESLRRSKGLEEVYLDGVSLTHGNPGSREHIWSFAIAASEFEVSLYSTCACLNASRPYPLQLPEFIGNSYYCDSGNQGQAKSSPRFYTENPVWDSMGCSPTSKCCLVNNQPWFCARLTAPTDDDLEARICTNAALSGENVVVTNMELYVK